MINEDNRHQILKKWIDLINPNEDGTQAIYAAMNEYAKQECIPFAKFVMEKTLQDCNTENKWTLDDFSEVTDEQLHELYLQSKSLVV